MIIPRFLVAGVLVGVLLGGPTFVEGQGAGATPPAKREQTTNDLRHFWNFDSDRPGEVPSGFSASTTGEGPSAQWKIEADPQAPTGPNRLIQAAPCPSGAATCFQVLLVEGTIYEYPDLAVRMRAASGKNQGQGGLVFGAQDGRNFYAAIVDLATDTLEVIRVLDGLVTLLGRQSVKRDNSEWHRLRAQHNTILSKDYVEVSFDGRVVFSTWEKVLGSGKIGLVTRGEAALAFDNLNAIQLFSQRPLSPPAAY